MRVPGFLEIEPGRFRASDDATVGQWRVVYRQLLDDRAAPDIVREVGRMIKLADAYGLSDDAPLLPQIAHAAQARRH
jgi:hypothetical protein